MLQTDGSKHNGMESRGQTLTMLASLIRDHIIVVGDGLRGQLPPRADRRDFPGKKVEIASCLSPGPANLFSLRRNTNAIEGLCQVEPHLHSHAPRQQVTTKRGAFFVWPFWIHLSNLLSFDWTSVASFYPELSLSNSWVMQFSSPTYGPFIEGSFLFCHRRKNGKPLRREVLPVDRLRSDGRFQNCGSRSSDRSLLEAQLMGTTAEELAKSEGVTPTAIRLRLLRARRSARQICEPSLALAAVA